MKLSGNTGLNFKKTSVLLKGITKQRKEMDDEVFKFPNNVYNLRIARSMHKSYVVFAHFIRPLLKVKVKIRG